MELTTFLCDLILVAVTTAVVLTPRVLDANLALRAQKNAGQAEGIEPAKRITAY